MLRVAQRCCWASKHCKAKGWLNCTRRKKMSNWSSWTYCKLQLSEKTRVYCRLSCVSKKVGARAKSIRAYWHASALRVKCSKTWPKCDRYVRSGEAGKVAPSHQTKITIMITRLGLSLNKKPTWKDFPCKRRCCDLGSQSYWLEVENFTPPHEKKKGRRKAHRIRQPHRIHLWFVQRCLPRNFACDWEKSCESGRGGKIGLDGIWNSNFYWETTGECESSFFPNGKGKPSRKDWFWVTC